MIVVLIPILRIFPALYRWRMKLRIYRWYRMLLVLEKDLTANLTSEKREELLGRLIHIEEEVNKMKMPASFGDQFYGLRGHVSFVRDRLMDSTQSHCGRLEKLILHLLLKPFCFIIPSLNH